MKKVYKCDTCGTIFDENRLGKMILSGYHCPLCEVGKIKEVKMK